MNLFFECTIRHRINSEDGKLKKFNYLVEGETYTEAEKNCYTIMNHLGLEVFSIDKIVKTDVNEVFTQDDGENTYYYSVKLVCYNEDEDGTELAVDKYHYVVRGSDIEPVARYVKSSFTVNDVVIMQQKRTNIVDFYSCDLIRQIEMTSGLVPVTKIEKDI